MTWKELKQQGVRRCCVEFKRGGRCRHRVHADTIGAPEGASTTWCKKHEPGMRAVYKWANQVARDERDGTNKAGKCPFNI